jgi:hypothetical protein
MKKKITKIGCSIALFSLLSCPVWAQKQGNNWHFGHAARLDFTTSPANIGSSSYDGNYATAANPNRSNEGVASISNVSGQTLFYTDGQKVYDKIDQLMPNGSGLLGSVSSTQSGIIVPKPGNGTQYFIFTLDAWGGSNLIHYSIVDTTLNNFKGDVIAAKKNIVMPYSVLGSPAHFAEKITAIPKVGGIGFWLIAHVSQETGANGTFIVWSIDCSAANDGISEFLVSNARQSVGTTNVYSGTTYDGNTLGYMKVSPDTKRIAYANFGQSYVEVFDFNNATGVISNARKIDGTTLGATRPYGIEFSPNSQNLFVGDLYGPNLHQYRLNGTNPNTAADHFLHTFTNTWPTRNGGWLSLYFIGALQYAPDGNIYVAFPGVDHLAKIANPDNFTTSSAFSANITETAITLNSGAFCTAGLPNFVSSFVGNTLITVTGSPCSYLFNYSASSNLPNITYLWNFGDGTTSTLANPTHVYNISGSYTVTLTITDNISFCSNTVKQTIQITGCSCIASIDPKYTKFLTNTTISTSTVWDDKIYIADNVIVTVDNAATLDITNVDVVFGHGAGMDFKNGATLRANNSVFRPCNIDEVWRGLDFYTTNSTPPLGTINACTFKNAKTAIESYAGTAFMNLDLRLTNNLFADCQRGIAFSNVLVKRAITGNTYMIDNKNLPFNTVSSNLNAAGAIEFYGLYSNNSNYTDIISQNNFVFTSNNGLNGARPFGMYFNYGENCIITDNKFTDFIAGIYGNYNKNMSVENNTFTWTNLFNIAAAPGNKVQILVNYAQNVLIKGNKIYSSNLMNSTSNTLPNITTATIGISSNGSRYVIVSQNEVQGCELGMMFVASNGLSNQYLFITENDIKKSWYYGIYVSSYLDVDISCNKIDMELNSNRDATGISYNNLLLTKTFYTPYYTNATNVAIRSNCVLNTKNGVYCYNQNNALSIPLPKVYNNFIYNYRQYGFENNGYTAVASTSPREVYHNTLISNNSLSGTVDVNSDASHIINLEANYGIQNSANVNAMLANTQSSTATCALQVGTFPNLITGNNGAQLCNYYYSAITSWTPVAKMIPMKNLPTLSDSVPDSTALFNWITPVHTTSAKIVYYKDLQFDVYPNPSHDKLNVQYNLEKADNAYLEIIDLQGRILRSMPLIYEHTNEEVNISDLANGVYFLRMSNSEKSVYYSKFIKN